MIGNEIVIDPEAILKLEDDSITEPFLIRQIALFGCAWENRDDPRVPLMNRKILKEMTFAALYPHVQGVHEISDQKLVDIMRDFRNKRKEL